MTCLWGSTRNPHTVNNLSKTLLIERPHELKGVTFVVASTTTNLNKIPSTQKEITHKRERTRDLGKRNWFDNMMINYELTLKVTMSPLIMVQQVF